MTASRASERINGTEHSVYTSADYTIEANAFLARMRGAEKFNPYREGTTAHVAYEHGWARAA